MDLKIAIGCEPATCDSLVRVLSRSCFPAFSLLVLLEELNVNLSWFNIKIQMIFERNSQ